MTVEIPPMPAIFAGRDDLIGLIMLRTQDSPIRAAGLRVRWGNFSRFYDYTSF